MVTKEYILVKCNIKIGITNTRRTYKNRHLDQFLLVSLLILEVLIQDMNISVKFYGVIGLKAIL